MNGALIQYKHLEERQAVLKRVVVKNRSELKTAMQEFKRTIPEKYISGDIFCIFYFVTSVRDGFDVEIGIPLDASIELPGISVRTLPPREVLSILHTDTPEKINESYRSLFTFAADRGLISDEMCCEIHRVNSDTGGIDIEILFFIHEWDRLFLKSLRLVAGDEVCCRITGDLTELTVNSTDLDRFEWVKKVLNRLSGMISEPACAEILTRCAHVFPESQLAKLRQVFIENFSITHDLLSAADAVIELMGSDPGWGESPRREGRIIYSSKKPRDPEKYGKAVNEKEKKTAYCFCPIVRTQLEKNMPDVFCFCGAGWYRQQWEAATGGKVEIQVIKSLLKGDDCCEFAVILPDECH